MAVVLLGAGHAHIEALRHFARRPAKDATLTLITPEARTPYSGMLPALVAGRCTLDDAHIDAAQLARSAGGRLILDEAVGLDLPGRRVLRRAGPPVPYQLLSIDIGARPDTGAVPGAAEHAIPAKPIGGFLARLGALRARVAAGVSTRIVLVGGGAAGVELLLSVEWRLRRPGVSFALVASSPDIMPQFPPAFRARFRAILAARNIAVHTGARVTRVTAGHVETGGGTIAADEVLWATGASPAAWLAGTGLALDGAGFVRVDACLRAAGRTDVFAAGDTIAFDPAPIPRAGAYAVRAGPVLARNIRAALQGQAPHAYRPQRHALAIVSTGGPHAVLTRNGLVAGGVWAERLKEWIDRRYVARAS